MFNMKHIRYKIFFFSIIFSGLFFACTQHSHQTTQQIPKTTVDSIRMLTKNIISDSSNYTLFLKRANLYLKLNKIDPCLRDIGYALKINTKDPEIFYTLSDAYFILGKVKESKDALKKAIILNPKREQSFLKLARLSLIIKDYNSALKYSDKALTLNPHDAQPFFIKAMVNIEQGDTSKSVQNLQIAININPKYFEANMQLGTVLSLEKDSLAIKCFKNALKIKPDNYAAFYGLAMAYQNSGKIDSALIIYDTILTKHPNDKHTYFNKGYIYLVEKSDFNKAIKFFEKALQIDSTYVEAIYNLGRSYEAENKLDKAIYYYKKSLRLLPNYPLAVAGINRIEH